MFVWLRSHGLLMLQRKMRYICRVGRPTIFEFGTLTDHEDPPQRHAQ